MEQTEEEQKEPLEQQQILGKDDPLYRLKLTIFSGKDLTASDATDRSDPYCLVTVDRQIWKTKTVRRSLSPEWNEIKEFYFLNPIKQIHFRVFDRDGVSADAAIGTASFDITKYYDDQSPGYEGPVPLENCSSGELQIGVSISILNVVEMAQKYQQLQEKLQHKERLISDHEKVTKRSKELTKINREKVLQIERLKAQQIAKSELVERYKLAKENPLDRDIDLEITSVEPRRMSEPLKITDTHGALSQYQRQQDLEDDDDDEGPNKPTIGCIASNDTASAMNYPTLGGIN